MVEYVQYASMRNCRRLVSVILNALLMATSRFHSPRKVDHVLTEVAARSRQRIPQEHIPRESATALSVQKVL